MIHYSLVLKATVRHFEPDSTRSSMRRSGGGYNNQEHKSVSRMASSARIQPIKPINRLRDSCVTLCSNCKSYTSLNRSNAPGSAAATRRSSAQQSQISLSHVGSFRGGAGGATMAMGSALSSRIASAVAVSEQPELQPVCEVDKTFSYFKNNLKIEIVQGERGRRADHDNDQPNGEPRRGGHRGRVTRFGHWSPDSKSGDKF